MSAFVDSVDSVDSNAYAVDSAASAATASSSANCCLAASTAANSDIFCIGGPLFSSSSSRG